MAAGSRPPARLQIVVLAPDGSRRRLGGLAAWLAGVAPRAARGAVTVALVSDRRIRTLNRTFRGVDAVTDVLSFPAFAKATAGESAHASKRTHSARALAGELAASGYELGDVVIAAGVAERQARAAGHGFATEVRVLALHGLLHLLGYDHDHDADGGAMARVERRLRRRGGLREGLIERAGPKGVSPKRTPGPDPARRPRRRTGTRR